MKTCGRCGSMANDDGSCVQGDCRARTSEENQARRTAERAAKNRRYVYMEFFDGSPVTTQHPRWPATAIPLVDETLLATLEMASLTGTDCTITGTEAKAILARLRRREV